MSKINEYPQAVTVNNNDLFVIDQESGGNHATKSARVSQIVDKAIFGVQTQIGDPNGNISDSYDPTAAYVKGDLCIYENVLYICTAPTTGTFDPSKWTATTIDNVIGDLSTLTTSDKSSLVGAVNEVVNTNTISVTKGSAVNTATVSCYQVGKLVQFYIVGDANTTWGGSSEIATGLPIPKDTNIRYGIHKTSAGSPYGIGTTYQCGIDSNGKLVPMYIPSGAIGNGDYFFISFCYIAKDLQ